MNKVQDTRDKARRSPPDRHIFKIFTDNCLPRNKQRVKYYIENMKPKHNDKMLFYILLNDYNAEKNIPKNKEQCRLNKE